MAYKAAESFFAFTGVQNRGTAIHIEKHIPFSAGLAGGSADAAATVAALDRLYGTLLSDNEKCRIGAKVGADVPFCLVGGTCLAQDIGQVLSPLMPLKNCFFVLVKPKQSVSTKAAYQAFDDESRVRHLDRCSMLHYAAKGDFEKICQYAGNVFEQFIEVHERVEIKRMMRAHNAKCALMSGSGPTIYGVFENESDAENCMRECKKIVDDIFICKPVNHGCKIME
ncbi:4-diphosphocytidyl-2-C-methyl-D-erythritol kinase [bioreactor metagenome]|uniref:4-(cytidine 5'-diphospho)-2-C-methyl-D-erythritol kinase n=1 Tax=bioreactor metagenome TaxID=1076179 RepID=A0A645GCM6_9ZZZZ